jgi:hypothetical protein
MGAARGFGAGYESAQQTIDREQQARIRGAAESRAAEQHPLTLQQVGQNIRLADERNTREAELQAQNIRLANERNAREQERSRIDAAEEARRAGDYRDKQDQRRAVSGVTAPPIPGMPLSGLQVPAMPAPPASTPAGLMAPISLPGLDLSEVPASGGDGAEGVQPPAAQPVGRGYARPTQSLGEILAPVSDWFADAPARRARRQEGQAARSAALLGAAPQSEQGVLGSLVASETESQAATPARGPAPPPPAPPEQGVLGGVMAPAQQEPPAAPAAPTAPPRPQITIDSPTVLATRNYTEMQQLQNAYAGERVALQMAQAARDPAAVAQVVARMNAISQQMAQRVTYHNAMTGILSDNMSSANAALRSAGIEVVRDRAGGYNVWFAGQLRYPNVDQAQIIRLVRELYDPAQQAARAFETTVSQEQAMSRAKKAGDVDVERAKAEAKASADIAIMEAKKRYPEMDWDIRFNTEGTQAFLFDKKSGRTFSIRPPAGRTGPLGMSMGGFDATPVAGTGGQR